MTSRRTLQRRRGGSSRGLPTPPRQYDLLAHLEVLEAERRRFPLRYCHECGFLRLSQHMRHMKGLYGHGTIPVRPFVRFGHALLTENGHYCAFDDYCYYTIDCHCGRWYCNDCLSAHVRDHAVVRQAVRDALDPFLIPDLAQIVWEFYKPE